MTKTCPVCTVPMPTSHTRPHVYCSHNCRQYAWKLERRAKHAAEVISAWEAVRARKEAK
jgi:hypothetical protein